MVSTINFDKSRTGSFNTLMGTSLTKETLADGEIVVEQKVKKVSNKPRLSLAKRN